MVQAEDSFRASMHVALPADTYESSARSLDEVEPVYREHSYFPAGETTSVRSFNTSAATLPNHNAAVVNGDHNRAVKDEGKVESLAKAVIEPVRKPILAKTVTALPGTKPPRVGVNIEWVQKGVGWDCREVYYVGKKRHRRHLGHIGRQKWEDMQQQFQGTELERVLSEWIEERRAEKSMSINNENAPE